MIQKIIGLHTGSDASDSGGSTSGSSGNSSSRFAVTVVAGIVVVVVGCCCGIVVVRINSGSIAEWLRFSTGVVMVMVVIVVMRIKTIVSDRFVMTLRDNVRRSRRPAPHSLDLIQLVALRLLGLLKRDQPARTDRFRSSRHRNRRTLAVHRRRRRRCDDLLLRRCPVNDIDRQRDSPFRRCSTVKVVVQLVAL